MTQGPGPQDPQNPYGQPGQGAPGQQPGGTPPPPPPGQPYPGQTPPPPPGQTPGGPGGPQYGQPYPGQTPPPPPGQTPPPPPGQQPGGQQPGGQQYGQPYPGQTPPPPPPGPASPSSNLATDSFKNGWELFKSHWANFVIAGLIWAVIIGAIVGIFYGILSAVGIASSRNSGLGGVFVSVGLVGIIFITFISVVAALVAQGGFMNAALKAHDTGSVALGDFFKIPNLPQVLLAGLVIGGASGLLSFTGIGSFLVGLFAFLAIPLVIDRGRGFWDAIMESGKTVAGNLGQTLLLYILMAVVLGLVTMITCGLGSIVALPISSLAIASFYRRVGEAPAEFNLKF